MQKDAERKNSVFKMGMGMSLNERDSQFQAPGGASQKRKQRPRVGVNSRITT